MLPISYLLLCVIINIRIVCSENQYKNYICNRRKQEYYLSLLKAE